MRFQDILISLLTLIVVLSWITGFDPENIQEFQSAVELGIVVCFLIGILPALIRKIGNNDIKKFLGVLPTLLVLMAIGYTNPEIDPMTLEILAIVILVLNLLTLSVVKRWFAKRFGVKSDHTETKEETS